MLLFDPFDDCLMQQEKCPPKAQWVKTSGTRTGDCRFDPCKIPRFFQGRTISGERRPPGQRQEPDE